MRFRQQQDETRAATQRLLLLFAVLLLVVVVAVNLALAGLYKLVTWGLADYPPLFFETNTAIVLLFVLGGCVVEAWRLRDGGGKHVAVWVGGRELNAPRDLAEKRLANVVDEMAIASGLARPALYVLEREDAINAFVAGWSPADTVLAVTRGALECLTRDELQGLVAHEFAHIHAGDLRLQMRLVALVWGLSLVHGYGRSLMEPDDLGHRSPPGVLVGAVFLAVGWVGWLAGRVLQAAVSRQREHAADASAVQFTRSRDGLGGTLRKIWYQSERRHGRLHHPRADVLAAMLLHMPARLALGSLWANGWLATHPPLAERVQRIYGREMLPLFAGPLDLKAEAAPMDSSRPTRDDAPLPAVVLQAANSMSMSANDSPPQFGPDLPDTEPPPGMQHAEPEGKTFVPLALQSPTASQDELDALGRLKFLQGPGERRAALLALLLTPGSAREKQAWREETEDVPSAGRVRADVQQLSFAARAPAFELLLERSRPVPVPERQALVEAARRVMSADGLVRPIDRLRWLAMRHRLGEARASRVAAPSSADNDMKNLPLSTVDRIATMTAFLARLVPASDTAAAVGAAGHAWYQAVMAPWAESYRSAGREPPPCRPPDADALMHALWGVQEMSWMLRPVLLRAWVDEAGGMSETLALREEAADALRLAALLLDAPMPPVLARHYLELKLA